MRYSGTGFAATRYYRRLEFCCVEPGHWKTYLPSRTRIDLVKVGSRWIWQADDEPEGTQHAKYKSMEAAIDAMVAERKPHA